VLGIEEEIQEHLLSWCTSPSAAGKSGAHSVTTRMRTGGGGWSGAPRLLDDGGHIHRRALGLALAREEEQALDDLGHALPCATIRSIGPRTSGGNGLPLSSCP